MPEPIHLDMNLSRALALNPKDKEHSRTITFNPRSANLLKPHERYRSKLGALVNAVGQRIAAETASSSACDLLSDSNRTLPMHLRCVSGRTFLRFRDHRKMVWTILRYAR